MLKTFDLLREVFEKHLAGDDQHVVKQLGESIICTVTVRVLRVGTIVHCSPLGNRFSNTSLAKSMVLLQNLLNNQFVKFKEIETSDKFEIRCPPVDTCRGGMQCFILSNSYDDTLDLHGAQITCLWGGKEAECVEREGVEGGRRKMSQAFFGFSYF